jgi:PAS domain S-box-containing protein
MEIKELENKLITVKDVKEQIDILNTLSSRTEQIDTKRSLKLAEKAYKLALRANYTDGIANGLKNIGKCNYLFANYDIAYQKSSEALALFEQTGNGPGEADALNNIGITCYRLADYDRSLNYQLKALEKRKEIGDSIGIAASMLNIGNVYNDTDDYENALSYFANALGLYKKKDQKAGEASALGNMGMVLKNKGDYKKSLEYELKAYRINTQLNNVRGTVTNLKHIAEIYLQLKNYTTAEKHFLDALELEKQLDNKWGQAIAIFGLGQVALETKRVQEAIKYFKKMLAISEKVKARQGIFNAHEKLYESYSLLGDHKTALEHYIKFHKIKEEVFSQKTATKIQNLRIESVQKEAEIERLKNVELKKAFEEIEEKNKALFRLSLVASETNNVVLILDEKGNLQWINETFTRYYGITYNDLIKEDKTSIFDISNNADIRKIFNDCIVTKSAVVYESRHITKLRGEMWIVNTLSPVLDENGNIKNLIIISTDITDRKRAEDIIKEKNRDIIDSINAARRIQDAIFPNSEAISKKIRKIFGLVFPKDIVSGDFYWITGDSDIVFIALADCTGHGVPGAMMTVFGISLLNRINIDLKNSTPADVLTLLDDELRKELRKSKTKESHTSEGMDIMLCKINKATMQIEYAGANRPLYFISDGVLNQIDGDKISIGGYEEESSKKFKNHVISTKTGDGIYLVTDGFSDQFGGPHGKKFSTKRVKEFLSSIQHLHIKEQRALTIEKLKDWKGDYEQTDDVSIIGIQM